MRPAIAWLRQLGCKTILTWTTSYQGGSQNTNKIDDILAGSTRICDQLLPEISVGTHSEDRLFGVHNQFTKDVDPDPTGENGEDAITSQESFEDAFDLGQRYSPVCRDNIIHVAGNSTNTIVLQNVTKGEECTELHPKWSGHSDRIDSSHERRTIMVDRSSEPVEQSSAPSTEHKYSDSDRCFEVGLGSLLQPNENWRSLDFRGSTVTHQLRGASSCIPGDTGFHKEQLELDHLPSDGQHVCPNLRAGHGQGHSVS